MAKHFDKQFKLDAVQYYHDHRELGLVGCASNLGISQQSLSRWQKELRESGDLKCRGSGNYSSDEAKEIARLKRELRDAKDALDVLKKAIMPHGNGIYHPILPNAGNCSRTRSKRFMTILIRIMVPLRSQGNYVKQGKTFLKELSVNT